MARLGIYDGSRFRLEWVAERCYEFYDSLSKAEKASVRAKMEYLADNYPPENELWFRKVQGSEELWELRASSNIRIFWFYAGSGIGKPLIIFANGFRKKSDKPPKREIERAERLCRQWQGGDLR